MPYILGKIVGIFYFILGLTWKYRVRFCEGLAPFPIVTTKANTSFVLGHWHQDVLPLVNFARHSDLSTLASKSKDGTIIASALTLLGFHVQRGSSSRGGASALLKMVEDLKNGPHYYCIAMDGPRGPRYKAKPGAFYLSEKTKTPLIQCLAECSSYWKIKNTWSNEILPKPFATITLNFYPVPNPWESNLETVTNVLNSRYEVKDSNESFRASDLKS